MAVTTQSNIKNMSRLYDQDSDSLFRGIIRLDDSNISQFDPFITGYGMFLWTKPVRFIETQNNDLWTKFKNFTEKACNSFEGINDLNLATEDIMGGTAGNSFKIASNAKDEFDTFTMKCYEFQGSPIRETLEYWLTGIRDPKTGYAHYHGAVDTLGYAAKNHTAELVYIAFDPSGSSKGIEYACFIANIMPTKVPKSHLNKNDGEHNSAQIDLEFTGVKYESQYINKIATQIVEKYRKIENYLDFNPKITI